MTFDNSPLNLQHSFSDTTYTYTCPVTAFYEVRLHVVEHFTRSARLTIQLDGFDAWTAYSGSPTQQGYAAAARLFLCETGMSVNVVSTGSTSYLLGGLFTTFSMKYVAPEGNQKIPTEKPSP